MPQSNTFYVFPNLQPLNFVATLDLCIYFVNGQAEPLLEEWTEVRENLKGGEQSNLSN